MVANNYIEEQTERRSIMLLKGKLFALITICIISMTLIFAAIPANANAAEEDGDIAINAQNFPDKAFRKYVSKKIDSDKDGILTQKELSSVKRISLKGKKIVSLKGIEHFTNLQKLSCEDNKIKSLDVSKNEKLTLLDVDNNRLKKLNVRSNIKLKKLGCDDNKLTALNARKNTKLTDLDCSSCKIKSLDLTKNRLLKKLDCGNNKLKKLSISKNRKLTVVECHINKLTKLNITKNTKLKKLKCFRNDIHILNAKKQKAGFVVKAPSNTIVQRRGLWVEQRRTQKTKTLKKIQ